MGKIIIRKTLIRNAVIMLCFVVMASSASAQEWYKFESKPMGFKIDFPGKPEESAQTIDNDSGELKLLIIDYDASKDLSSPNLEYMVNYTAYPENMVNSKFTEKLPAFFKAAEDGMVKNTQGKILSEKEIEFKGYPGREIKMEVPDYGISTVKYILVGNKLYLLVAFALTNKDDNADMIRFFNSFDLE